MDSAARAAGSPGSQEQVQCQCRKMDVWSEGAAPIDEEELVGRSCYAGLNLARVNDLSSLALIFPPQHEGEASKSSGAIDVPRTISSGGRDATARPTRSGATRVCWLPPKATRRISNSSRRRFWRLPRASWSRTWLTIGPSPARSCATSRTKGCRWSSSARAFSAWGRPCLLIGRALQHGGNPITTGCASNVSVRKDPAGTCLGGQQWSMKGRHPKTSYEGGEVNLQIPVAELRLPQ